MRIKRPYKPAFTGQGRACGHVWCLVCPFGYVVGVLHWFHVRVSVNLKKILAKLQGRGGHTGVAVSRCGCWCVMSVSCFVTRVSETVRRRSLFTLYGIWRWVLGS